MNDDELRGLFEAMRQENAIQFAQFRQENAAEFARMRQENAAEFGRMRRENAEMHGETRQRLDYLTTQTEAEFEQVKHKLDLLGDGFILVNDRIDRTTSALDVKIDETAAETHALIRLTFGDVDRRVRVLEAK